MLPHLLCLSDPAANLVGRGAPGRPICEVVFRRSGYVSDRQPFFRQHLPQLGCGLHSVEVGGRAVEYLQQLRWQILVFNVGVLPDDFARLLLSERGRLARRAAIGVGL
jgi:hypothetical protein